MPNITHELKIPYISLNIPKTDRNTATIIELYKLYEDIIVFLLLSLVIIFECKNALFNVHTNE